MSFQLSIQFKLTTSWCWCNSKNSKNYLYLHSHNMTNNTLQTQQHCLWAIY